MFRADAERLRDGTDAWRRLEAPAGIRFPWDPRSTYIRRPPHPTGLSTTAPDRLAPRGAKVLLHLGNDVTTDHISPAGRIPADSAAGRWLTERGVARRDLNQYATRRSNHEVMLRGAFTNPTVTNLAVRDRDAGQGQGLGGHAYTADRSAVLPVHEAAPTYRQVRTRPGRRRRSRLRRRFQPRLGGQGPGPAGRPRGRRRVVRAHPPQQSDRHGRAAAGVHRGRPRLLVRLHRRGGADCEGFDGLSVGTRPIALRITRKDGSRETVDLRLRIFSGQELSYLRHGGILPYVVRRTLDRS